MSGNVRFNTVGTGIASKRTADNKPRVILPYDFLVSLHGRRVVVLLSYQQNELEGCLAEVDAEKGDVLLEDVVQYRWEKGQLEGSTRVEVQRFKGAMVNCRYIEIIAPT